MQKLVATTCIAALGVLALLPASANATKSSTRVTIAIKPTGNGFRGKVKSPRASCVADRKVTLQRRKAGQDNFTGVGSDRAASDGSWSVRTPPINRARYRAVINPKAGSSGCFGSSTEATKAHRTSLTIARTTSSFRGKISSAANCVRDRKVVLQRKAPDSTAFQAVGSDLSDKDGRWVVSKQSRAGSAYRASARARQVNSTTSCMRGRSDAVPG